MPEDLPPSANKIRLTITIDPQVHADAIQLNLNMSGLCNEVLKAIVAAVKNNESDVRLSIKQQLTYQVTIKESHVGS